MTENPLSFTAADVPRLPLRGARKRKTWRICALGIFLAVLIAPGLTTEIIYKALTVKPSQ